jgi:hypothetical protein
MRHCRRLSPHAGPRLLRSRLPRPHAYPSRSPSPLATLLLRDKHRVRHADPYRAPTAAAGYTGSPCLASVASWRSECLPCTLAHTIKCHSRSFSHVLAHPLVCHAPLVPPSPSFPLRSLPSPANTYSISPRTYPSFPTHVWSYLGHLIAGSESPADTVRRHHRATQPTAPPPQPTLRIEP